MGACRGSSFQPTRWWFSAPMASARLGSPRLETTIAWLPTTVSRRSGLFFGAGVPLLRTAIDVGRIPVVGCRGRRTLSGHSVKGVQRRRRSGGLDLRRRATTVEGHHKLPDPSVRRVRCRRRRSRCSNSKIGVRILPKDCRRAFARMLSGELRARGQRRLQLGHPRPVFPVRRF